MKDVKKLSREEWLPAPGGPSMQDLSLGCLQRIAAATEVMAKQYNDLLADAKYQKEAKERAYRECDRANRSNAALRGVIKRMKKKAQR